MGWETVPLAGSLGNYRDDWDRLNATLYRSQPFFDSRFIEPMLKFFATGEERLCVHSQHGEIDGLLILTPRRTGIWSLFTPSQMQIVPILLKDSALLHSLIKVLPSFTISVEFLRQDPLLTPFNKNVNALEIIHQSQALTITVTITNQFSDYWSLRSKNLKKNHHRHFKRQKKNFQSMRLGCHETPDSIHEAVNRYGIMESRGWKGWQGTSLNPNNKQGACYAELMEHFAESDNASVYELYFDDLMVASRLCVLNSVMLIILKTTYHEDLAEYAPGQLLLHAVLEKEFLRQRVKAVEFYTNATPDQVSWSTDQRLINNVTLFRHSLLKHAYLFKRSLRQNSIIKK